MDELDLTAIRIDDDSPTPLFEQVRSQVAGLIAHGDLAPGTKLPTVRRTAAELGLAVNTAARVFRELEADGLVTTEGRRGTFVASAVTAAPGTAASATGTSGDAVAERARETAAGYAQAARRLGLTRAEAVRLLEHAWSE